MRLKSCVWKPVTFKDPQPKSRATPNAVALHTNAIPNGPASLFGAYQARAQDAESPAHLQVAHIQIARDGTAEQYADTDVILGLTWDANPFTVGIETQDGGPVETTPWNQAQLDKIHDICVELGVPARALPEDGSGGGVGYHQQYPDWNQSGHNCPGTPRRNQVADIIADLAEGDPSMGKANEYAQALEDAGTSADENAKDTATEHGFWRRVRSQPRPDPAKDPNGAEGWDAAKALGLGSD